MTKTVHKNLSGGGGGQGVGWGSRGGKGSGDLGCGEYVRFNFSML